MTLLLKRPPSLAGMNLMQFIRQRRSAFFSFSYTNTYQILYLDDTVPDSMAYDDMNPKFDETLKETLQLITAGKK